MFITVLPTARHLSLSWARLIPSTPSHPVSVRSILILSFHLRLGLLCDSFPQVSPLIPRITTPLPCKSHMSHLFLLDLTIRNIWSVQIIKRLIMQLLPVPCYLVPLAPKHLPQPPILKDPQPMSPPHLNVTGRFTPNQNNTHNYCSIY